MVLKRLLLSLWRLSNFIVDDAKTQEVPKETIEKIKVEFYGESECPYCRKFVTEAWPEVWSDSELKELVEYTMIPWGNAYFATNSCGGAPYNAQTRACWYKTCVAVSADDADCFSGEVIYQHGGSEGALDIYESCVLNELGITMGVSFAECVEGPNMEKFDRDVAALVEHCISCSSCLHKVEACVAQNGKELEVQMAKATPSHPGVPYVLVNGKPIDEPLDVQQAVCEALPDDARPSSCKSGTFKSFLRLARGQMDESQDFESEFVHNSICA
mmetsp:Transcript_1543/g.2108  ORF Transcript_1543/g.2108 Transcript_1543/m.2108 type:complete len:272 (-) Transcript_1543:82-897(-)